MAALFQEPSFWSRLDAPADALQADETAADGGHQAWLRGLLSAARAPWARVERILAHKSFQLTSTPLRGCSQAVPGPGLRCFGGAWAVALRLDEAFTLTPGWVALQIDLGELPPACSELALEAEGPSLPPHSLRQVLQRPRHGNVWRTDYFLAPGTERLVLVGRARSGTQLTLKRIVGHEQGSHEAEMRGQAHALWARARDVGHFKQDLRQLAHCVRKGDWQKIARAVRKRGGPVLQRNSYEAWVARHDTLTTADVAAMQSEQASWTAPPHFSLIVPCYNSPAEWLLECIESVEHQVYPHWQLCLSNDASTQPHVREILDQAARRDSRIVVVHCAQNGHISRASNAAIGLASHPWLALLDHDDTLAPHALHMMAQAIVQNPQAQLLYSDEDKLDGHGHRLDPYFKPSWNPDLLRSQNYVSHLGVYRKSLVDKVGGFRVGLEGSQDYDLVLRVSEQLQPHQIVHVPHVLYHWRMVPGSAATGSDSKPYAYVAAERALNEHMQRTGRNAQVRPSIYPGLFHAKYPVGNTPPKVSIIIPSRDNVRVLDRCIDTLRDKTSYLNYEVCVVDNDSRDARTHRYMAQLGKKPGVRTLAYDFPFNYAAINNWAVQQCDGEIVCLLNDDVEILHGDWLEEMVGHALRPEIGCVGAKLLYPNRTLQHGGIALGVGGIAAHAFRGVGEKDPAYFGRAVLAYNVTAVTAACMVVRRSSYLDVGGFDERLAVAYNDVDFCLRLYQQGYDNVWTPHATLLHHESVSRGMDTFDGRPGFREEWRWMAKRWKAHVAFDPNYNPNLTLEREDYSTGDKPRHVPRYALRPDLQRGRLATPDRLQAPSHAPAGMAGTQKAASSSGNSRHRNKVRVPAREPSPNPGAHVEQ